LLDGAEYGQRGQRCGGVDDVYDLDEMLRNVESEFIGKSQNDKFSQIMKNYETPLFSGCKKEYNKLYVVLTFLQMKASNGWSNKGFNELL
jgi:vacuolar-type H+-ATPase subunit B/Vma2